MTAFVIFASVAAVLICVGLAWMEAVKGRQAASEMESDWMPDELKGAELAFSEPTPMKIEYPVPVAAKVDRAYRHGEGDLSVVEFKTRARHVVYPSDVLELSQQRLVLEKSGRGRVRSVGYVVTERRGTNDRKTHRVRLLDVRQAVEAARRYLGIVDGSVTPRKTENVRLCAKCAFVQQCRPELASLVQRPQTRV